MRTVVVDELRYEEESAGQLAIEVEEDMALRNEDKIWIKETIQDAVRNAIAPLRPSGWRKFVVWAREWGILGTIVTVIVAMIGITTGALYQSFSHIKEESAFRTHTNDTLDAQDKRLSKIEADLLELRAAQSPAEVLKDIGKLDEKRLTYALPALQAATKQTPKTVNVDQATLRDIAGKLLRVDTAVPDYWPAVLQFLRFASATTTTDVPAPGTSQLIIARNNGGLSLGHVDHKTVVLDGGQIVDTEFQNCRIVFTNNPVAMKNVTFKDSVFDLPVSSNPNQYLQRAGRTLLASNLADVSIQTF